MSVAIVGWWDEGHPNVIGAVAAVWRSMGTRVTFIAETAVPRVATWRDFTLVVWWNWVCMPIDALAADRATNTDTRHVMFNWDDPFCWRVATNRTAERAALMDAVFVSSSARLGAYTAAMRPDATVQLLYPPVSAATHAPGRSLTSARVRPDVVFIFTNLYTDRVFTDVEVPIRRQPLLQALEAADDLVLHVYAPPSYQAQFPRSYKGEISYHINAAVFEHAALALSTHVIQAENYLNERCMTILASGGVLLVDDIAGHGNGLLRHGENCVIMDCTSTDAAMATIRQWRGADTAAIRAAGIATAREHFDAAHWIATVTNHK